jgi:hypothetical protein
MSKHPATELMNTLFTPGDWVELRSLISGKPAAQRWIQLGTDDLDAAWRDLHADDVRSHYFGANPRTCKGGSAAGDVAVARCVYVDFDPEGDGAAAYANAFQVDVALARIEDARLPHPTAILKTPKGVHAYWRLEEPVQDLRRWTRVQKAIIQAVGSDPSVHDAPRVMRLPGFACRKPLAQGRITELVDVDAGRTYSLEEFPSDPQQAADDVPALRLDELVPLADGREVPEHTRWVLEQATTEQLHRGKAKGRRGELYHQAVHLTRLGWREHEVKRTIRQAAERLSLSGWDLDDLIGRQVPRAVHYAKATPRVTTRTAAPAEEVLPWRPFPVDALPPVVREMVLAAAPSAQVDPAMAAVMALGVLAGAIGRTRLLHLNTEFIVPPMLWMGVVAESGGGKSPCMRLMASPLVGRETELQDKNAEAMARYQVAKQLHDEAMQHRRKSKAPKDDPPTAPTPPALARLRVDNTTMEALVPILRDNPAGVLGLHDELAAFVGGFDQYRKGGKGSDAAHYLRMHDGDSIIVDRKGDGCVHVKVAALSVLGGIQPGRLRRLLGPGTEHAESGMLARFQLVWPPELPKKEFRRAGVDSRVRERWHELVRKLCALRADLDPSVRVPAVTLSEGAAELFERLVPEHHADARATTGPLRSALVKLEGVCARLALVHHTALSTMTGASENVLPPESMQAAIAMVRWWRHETRRVYAELRQETDLARLDPVLEFLGKHPGSTAAEVARNVWKYRGRTEPAEADLMQLQNRGRVQSAVVPPSPRGGPAAARWRLTDSITITTTPANAEESGGSGDGDAATPAEWGVR